jgi:ankyrin repeat protein
MLGEQDTSYSLICAVREGRLERVRELINSFGLSYSQAWSEGYVLLRDAVKNKHTEVAKLLLMNGSKVNSKNQKPTDTPLHYAAIHGDIEIVEMLLSRGAKINAENRYGITALHGAVKSKNMEIIELLLRKGANVNTRNNYGITPLHHALEQCSEEIIKLLLSRV